MTCIVWDGQTLAADKLACFGDLKRTVTKIVKRNGCLLAYAGIASIGEHLADWWASGRKIDKWPNEFQKDENMQTTLWVIYPDKTVHCYECTPFPIKVEDPWFAAGSGRDFAVGAMAMGADAKRAVEIAATHCISVGGGIDTLTL